jgi:predicted phage terminase large subunit-like protein
VPDFSNLSLLELVPALSPEHASPFHLHEWCRLIERAKTESVRGLCAIPIRHYKTETTLHGIVLLLIADPTRRIIYLTHSLTVAQKRGKRLRELAKEAGVGPARGYDTITDWENEKGGGVVVMSADQSKLGLDCHVLVVDDPLDENNADDPQVRETVDHTIAHYDARCMRRGVPGPVLILMSRWHPDDPIGRRLVRTARQWEYVHHPGIMNEGSEDERAFAPEVWPLAALKQMRAELKEQDPSERLFFAQIQNDPQPQGSDLFGAETLYTELPTFGFRIGHGVDFAFTDAPGSDFFSVVSGRLYGDRLYLLHVQRERLDTTLLESTCRGVLTKYGRAPMWSYQSGPEIGTSKLLVERGIPIARMPARYNKLVRAQRTITRWNTGKILVPEQAAWRPGFVQRLSIFRGHPKDRDDEADALVSLSDATQQVARVPPPPPNARKPFRGLYS